LTAGRVGAPPAAAEACYAAGVLLLVLAAAWGAAAGKAEHGSRPRVPLSLLLRLLLVRKGAACRLLWWGTAEAPHAAVGWLHGRELCAEA
jgi:hypothetical protein